MNAETIKAALHLVHHLRELQASAFEAGNDMQFCVCVIALEGPIDSFEDRFEGGNWRITQAQERKLESLTQDEAVELCRAERAWRLFEVGMCDDCGTSSEDAELVAYLVTITRPDSSEETGTCVCRECLNEHKNRAAATKVSVSVRDRW